MSKCRPLSACSPVADIPYYALLAVLCIAFWLALWWLPHIVCTTVAAVLGTLYAGRWVDKPLARLLGRWGIWN